MKLVHTVAAHFGRFVQITDKAPKQLIPSLVVVAQTKHGRHCRRVGLPVSHADHESGRIVFQHQMINRLVIAYTGSATVVAAGEALYALCSKSYTGMTRKLFGHPIDVLLQMGLYGVGGPFH